MAKFKLGDKVTDGNAVYEITGIDNGFGSYEWKFISGRADPSHSEGGDFGWADAKMKIANSAPVSANSVVRNAMAANVRTARNADVDADKDKLFKGEIDRISARITSELKNQAENYAYWINRNCGNDVDYLFENIEKHKDELSPSIIAEAKKLRKRVDDAIAASKRLPR